MSAFDRLRESLTVEPEVPEIAIDRTPRGERSAAVLALFTEEDDPYLTFITRAATLRRHAGQIALPGGAPQSLDLLLDELVPRLVEAGRFRRGYTAETFAENMGIA